MFAPATHFLSTNARRARQELVQNRRTVGFLILLWIAALAPALFVEGLDGYRTKGVTLLVGIALLLLAFVQRYAFLAVCVAMVPANLVYQHLQRNWGDRQLDSRIEAAFESPPGEMFDYLRANFDLLDAAFILLSVLYLIVLARAIFRTRKMRLIGLRNICGVVLIVWLGLLGALRVDQKLTKVPPLRLLAEIADARHRYIVLTGRQTFLKDHPLGRQACPSKYDKVVIVLGESALSDHMSLFGYPKRTTPFAERSGAHAFDALAPSNQTRYAIPMMLTDAGPGRFDRFYRSHSLVGELRACGFRTSWISNQGRLGMYDSFTTSLAREADEQIFLNDLSWTGGKYDGKIVPELAARGIYARHHQATFIHLIGSHVDYGQRYPEGFGFDDTSGIVAKYDNSLLYTDRVLSELYERFRGDSLLFIYVSDHGQFVSEDEFGSGFLPGYREEYRVPLLIWTADSQAIARIRSDVGSSKLNTDSLNHVVRFLLGHAPSPNVSTARTVTVLKPENVRVYDELKSFIGD